MDKVVDRLEAITKRLEALEGKLGSGGGGGGGGGGSSGAGGSSASVQAFDAVVNEHIPKFMECSNKLGGDIAEQAKLLQNAVNVLRGVLATAAVSKKPSDSELPNILKPLSEAMQQVIQFRDQRRGSKEFDHLSTVSEGVNAFSWVSVSPTPHPFAVQCRAGGEFYSNKLLRLYKGKDETQMGWVNSFTGFLKGMEDFIKEHHRTGLEWSGTETAKAPAASASAPAPAKAAAAPAKKPALGGGGAGPSAKGGLFAELSKGTAISSGLKKVDRSQMTHKNPELRKQGGMVPAAAAKKTPVRRGVPSGTPKFGLEGNKWVVEFQDSNKGIVIENPEIKHTVYVYGCFDCVVQVKGKVNQITMDSCKKVSIVTQDVVSGCEMVNVQSAEMQITGKCRTVNVEKVSGANIYLSDQCIDADIITAKSDSVNVSIPKGDGEFTEVPVPEQFKSNVVNGKLVTAQVDHSD